MRILLGVALALAVSGAAQGGMGLSTQRWRQFRSDARFLGVFRDFRGARAAFFVEEPSGLALGPLDLDAPSGPGWPIAPGPAPGDLAPGDAVVVVWAGIVEAERPFGFPPDEDLSKTRADRARAKGPLDGTFVSVEKRRVPKKPLPASDVLARVLLGEEVSPQNDEERHRAAWGALLRGQKITLPAEGDFDLAALGTLIRDGLRGYAKLPDRRLPPIAALWLAGKKREARAAALAEREALRFYLPHDRWKRPATPLESAPGAPLPGPFLRLDEIRALGFLPLHYLAPEFLALLVDAFKWQDPPF